MQRLSMQRNRRLLTTFPRFSESFPRSRQKFPEPALEFPEVGFSFPILSYEILKFKDNIPARYFSRQRRCLNSTSTMENPGADDPCGQVDLTPEAKIGLPPLPKIKMTPVDIEPPGDFICIFGFRFGRRGIKPKKHEYKVKKHSPVSRIGNGNKKHQQCF